MTLQDKMNKALENRFSSISSPIYSLKLTKKVTPRGLSIFKISASARKVTKQSGLPTPQARDCKGAQGRAYKGLSLDLPATAQIMADWGTPDCTNFGDGTPWHIQQESLEKRRKDCKERGLNGSGRSPTLQMQAQSGMMLSGFTVETTNTDQSLQDLNQLSGQLNPRLPAWLMGYPQGWCIAAITAHRLMPMKRKKRG